MIFANADILTGIMNRTALTHKNVSGFHLCSAENLDTQPLTV
jgi:hypothetical protein